MRVDLLLVLRFQDKDDLNWNQVIGVVFVRKNQLRRRVHGELSGVLQCNVSSDIRPAGKTTDLENVRYRVFSIHLLLHDTVLVNTHSGQEIEHALIHWLQTIDDESDYNPLPTWHTFFGSSPPVLGLLCLANITNVQHDTMERTSIECLVFIVRCDSNENFSLAVVELRS